VVQGSMKHDNLTRLDIRADFLGKTLHFQFNRKNILSS